MESTTLPPVICDRDCERSIDCDVNGALSEKLTRDIALEAAQSAILTPRTLA